MEPQTVAQGATITLPDQKFNKFNFAFAGWSTTKDGEVAYADKAEYTMGTQNATLYAVWKPALTGNFTYQALSTTYGQTQTSNTPSWSGNPAGQTVTYTIAPPNGGSTTGISIDLDTGVVTIGNDAPVQNATSYTVTATGTGDYAGTVTGSINITITSAIVTGTFNYLAISTTYGQTQTSSTPNWSGNPAGQTVTYTIAPPNGGSTTGISINEDTGVVTIGTDAPIQNAESYTVTATGKDNYVGTLTGSISITITPSTVTGTFNYLAISTTYGQPQTSDTPNWRGNPSGQTVTYTIAPPNGGSIMGISINKDTGVVSIGSDAPVQNAEIYTVTATGTGNYVGTVTGSISITITSATVTGTFTYSAISTAYGQTKTSNTPNWIGNPAGQTVRYTIAPPIGGNITGISINEDTGVVSIGPDAPVQSVASYTVTATGKDNYAGTVTGSISITVSTATVTGTFSYLTLITTYGQPKTSNTPNWRGNPSGQTVTYSIASPNSGSTTGISINEDTGVVSIGNDAPVQNAESYTVTATGTGDYVGTVIGSISITVNSATVTGTFNYLAISTTYGQPQTSNTPNWNGNPTGQTVTYSIAPPNGGSTTGISINEDTGVVTVGTDAPVQNAESYTVTATGTGDYADTVTGSIIITITPATVTGTFVYPAITTTYGQSQAGIKPSWNNAKSGQTISYTIALSSGGSTTGISINKDTGVVTVGTDAPAIGSVNYNVTATGTGNYVGTVTGSINITVNRATVTGTFSYSAISTTDDQAITGNKPSWNNALAGQKLSYTITPPIGGSTTGISIKTDTGEVSVDTNAPVQSSARYTVTATGTGNYVGTVVGSISITVYPANTVPGAPAISSTTDEPEQVRIVWEAPTDTGYINSNGTKGVITKYKVYYSTKSDFIISAADGSRETTLTVTTISGLSAGTLYYFKVTAFNATGESQPSTAGNATPISQSHTQQTVTLADGSTTSVWTLNGNSDFVYVEGGTFLMGAQKTDPNSQNYDADANSGESPVHQVTLSSFYISKYEVTHRQYIEFLISAGVSSTGHLNGNEVIDMDDSEVAIEYSTGSFIFKGSGSAGNENTPVMEVTWYGGVEYANWKSRQAGLTPVYTVNNTTVTANWNANGYRLPTEAEWEYAARGGKNSKGYVYSGSDTVGDVAWYWDNSSRQTQNVGTKLPNELGLYDMSGNVEEWCWDRYGSYKSMAQTNPLGPSSGLNRVHRSGNWSYYAKYARITERSLNSPSYSDDFIGFRLVVPVL